VEDAGRAYAARQAALYEEWREQVFEKIQVGRGARLVTRFLALQTPLPHAFSTRRCFAAWKKQHWLAMSKSSAENSGLLAVVLVELESPLNHSGVPAPVSPPDLPTPVAHPRGRCAPHSG
jgi:hypothetical protein